MVAPEDRDPGWNWMRPAELAWHLTEEQGRLVRALERQCAVVRLRPVPPMGVLRIVVACWHEAGSANARPPDRQWQVEADGTRTALAAWAARRQPIDRTSACSAERPPGLC